MPRNIPTIEHYRFYKNATDEKNKVGVATYRKLVNGFIIFLMDKVIEGNEVKLGSGDTLGSLEVRGKKVVPEVNDEGEIIGLAVDWAKTRQLWKDDPIAREQHKKIYHFNDHSDGIRYKVSWLKRGMKVANNNIYCLMLSKGMKGNKRKISNMVRANKEYFINPVNKTYTNG